MEIIIETTEQDHIDFYRDYALKKNWLWRFLIFLVVVVISPGFVQLSSFYLINLLFIGIMLVPFFFGIPYFFSKKRIRKAYDNLLHPTGQKTYKPFASGIEIIDKTTTTFLRYEDIKQVAKAGNFVFIITQHTGYYLLPIWCFSSEDQVMHFLSIVTNGIAHAKGIQPKTPFTFKPGYLVAILCLIPVIGFFAGIVVFILGIIHYKDKVFVIMGAIGMLITIAMYGSIIYFAQTSSTVNDGFSDITQTQLNDLVKSIEFYKLQNGLYPDSLQQIETKNSFISIDDPLQTFKEKKIVRYQYQRMGNKYLLFSVGKDGKSNTSDDIYPTITGADTSKLGFIRK